MNVARLNGKQIGRVTGTTIESNKSKVAKATFYKYVKELKEEI